jgi:hypothetical protein
MDMDTLYSVMATLTSLCLFTYSLSPLPFAFLGVLHAILWLIFKNFQLTSLSDDEFEAFDREFLQQQQAAEERIRREKLDAEFARSIQDYSTASAMNPPPNPTISAFDRLAGVPPRLSSSAASMTSSHTQNGQSGATKLPWNTPSSQTFGAPSVKSEPRSMTSGVKLEGSSNSHTGFGRYASMQNINSSPFKIEPSYSQPMPGSFRDDSSNASDSDIEIIPPSEFHDNGRHSRTPTKNQILGSSMNAYDTPQAKIQRHSFSPEAQTAGNAALRRMGQSASNDALQMAMYGKQQASKTWMEDPAGMSSGSTLNPFGGPNLNPFGSGYLSGMTSDNGLAGGYVYPSAYSNGMNNLTNGMITYPSAYPSGSMQNSLPGLGYSLNNALGTMAGYGMDLPQSFSSSPQASSSDELGDIIRRAGNNYNEISDYLKLDRGMADQFDYIMNDPRKTNQEIKELLENIRPDVELPPEDREGTPEGLVYPLVSFGPKMKRFANVNPFQYEHQKLALTWLKSMEEGTNKGGILADDMGLGKTISALALILTRPPTERTQKA